MKMRQLGKPGKLERDMRDIGQIPKYATSDHRHYGGVSIFLRSEPHVAGYGRGCRYLRREIGWRDFHCTTD